MSFGAQYGTKYEVINKIYTKTTTVYLCISVYEPHHVHTLVYHILFRASPFTEWKHNTTLVIANTCTHWCVLELVDCSALASHYQLITLHAHTVYMYALSIIYVHMQHK